MKRSRERLALPLAVVLLAACEGEGVRSLIYPAPAVPVGAPPAPLESVEIPWDGEMAVHGWLGRGGDRGTVAVLFLHGNAENLETMRLSGILEPLAQLGAAFLVVDYPGYGRSAGTASERSVARASLAAFDWLTGELPAARPVVAGWSLGAAAAVRIAAERAGAARPPAALIALSPFTSILDAGADHFPRPLVRLFVRERWDSLAAAPRLALPALVLHGTADRVIPVAHGRRLAAAIPGARFVAVEGAGHNDLLGYERVWREMAELLRGAAEGAGAGADGGYTSG